MTLKSSKVKNFSWRISSILKSSFYSSSCCQACFPSIVRPMNRLWELILKIILNSLELNCSVFFSLYCLRVSKKKRYFLRYLIFGERIFPWFNIDPIPSFNGNDSWWRASRFSSLWFCFLPSIGMQNLVHSVLTHILRADLRLFPPPLAMVLFHFTSDQCRECTKWFRRWSFNL